MKNNTGRIYEILKLLNGVDVEVMREVLHEAWPVYFQITQLTEDDYEKFKGNITRLLQQIGHANNSNHHGNGSRLPG